MKMGVTAKDQRLLVIIYVVLSFQFPRDSAYERHCTDSWGHSGDYSSLCIGQWCGKVCQLFSLILQSEPILHAHSAVILSAGKGTNHGKAFVQ